MARRGKSGSRTDTEARREIDGLFVSVMIVSVPALSPGKVGLKVTLIVQFSPAPRIV